MRKAMVAVAAISVTMTGCGMKVPFVTPRPASVAAKPGCAPMTSETWRPAVDGAIHKTFDRELQKRFGDTQVHSRIGWGKDDKGHTVITALRVGPAKYAMPEVDKGGEVEVVFQACTGKVLKVRKLKKLERSPKPLAAQPAGN